MAYICVDAIIVKITIESSEELEDAWNGVLFGVVVEHLSTV